MNIREMRKRKGLTLKELGRRVGCSESAMSQYETGKRSPDYETLLKIAEELDTDVVFLLTGSSQQTPAPEDERTKEIIEMIAQLTPQEKDLVIAQLKGILAMRKNHPAPGQ